MLESVNRDGALTHDSFPIARKSLLLVIRTVANLALEEIDVVPADPFFASLLQGINRPAEHSPAINDRVRVIDWHIPAGHVHAMESRRSRPFSNV